MLDEATCNILRRRARYGPGIDKQGRPVVSTVDEFDHVDSAVDANV